VGVLTRLLQHASFPELQKAACIAILGGSYSNPEIGKHFVDGKAIEALATIVKAVPHGSPPTPVAYVAISPPLLLILVLAQVCLWSIAWPPPIPYHAYHFVTTKHKN
jgi:hypothetical protein